MKGNYVGQSVPRIDARAKALGTATYPGDLVMEGMLHMKMLFARRPHARVVRVDTSTAMKVPGVIAIFTSLDLPVNEYGLQYADQPVLCGPGSPIPGADIVRFVGDQIAAVVATTEEQAAAARDLIVVEYEDLPVITDPRDALKPEAPILHPPHPHTPIHPELVFEKNVASRHRINHGDVDAALAQAAVVVESEYNLPPQEHAYLQPEAGLAYIDDQERVTVVSAGQWAHEDRRQIAHALGLPEDKVRVIYPAIGGAFGGREDLSVQVVLGLAALRLHQPVRIVWTREESIIGHHKRHGIHAKARWAADAEGRLIAADTEVIADGGAYVYTTNKVMGNLLLTVNGPYRIPNVRTLVLGVYTNNIPGGAFRGFGAPQGNFICESQMNKLAEALGLDPVEFRLRNMVEPGDPMPWGRPLPEEATGLKKTLLATAESLGWKETPSGWTAPDMSPRPGDPPYLKRGVGIALGFKNVGFSFGYQDNAWAAMELFGDSQIEEAVVFVATAEVGQGTYTVIRQMAAEALGIDLEKVRLAPGDTATSQSSGSVSASRMTFMIGNAIRGAAATALEDWKAENRPARGEFTYLAPKTTPIDPQTGHGDPNFSYGYVTIGTEITVDTRLGTLKCLRLICADDVGQAINPALAQGQIEGGVIQGLGWSTTEHFIQKEGRALTSTFTTYLMPGIADVPPAVETILIEEAEANGPWGARGIAEMPLIPVASALHHALRRAAGVWYNTLPFNAERILRGLKGK